MEKAMYLDLLNSAYARMLDTMAECYEYAEHWGAAFQATQINSSVLKSQYMISKKSQGETFKSFPPDLVIARQLEKQHLLPDPTKIFTKEELVSSLKLARFDTNFNYDNVTLYLIPLRFSFFLNPGIEVISISGAKALLSEADKDTRGGYLAYGWPEDELM